MKLAEIFSQLTYGELSQLSIGGAAAGTIDTTNYPAVLAHVSLGLTALYKRFPIKEKRLLIMLLANRTVYPLTSDYADSNVTVNGLPRFISDSAEPFLDDLLKVENVYTETGKELSLNDRSDTYSVFTPTAQSLRIHQAFVDTTMDLPDELVTDSLELVYRAKHPAIAYDPATFDPATVEIELPYSHLEALLLFVASRVHNPIGMTNEFHAGNSYAAKYEQACQLLEIVNLKVDQGSQNDKLERGGWV